MTDQEKAIARKLIQKLLDAGHKINVYCEDVLDVENSTDMDKIFDYATACYYVTISTVAGSFTLVYGNDPDGSELIADHSFNPFCNQIAQEIADDDPA